MTTIIWVAGVVVMATLGMIVVRRLWRRVQATNFDKDRDATFISYLDLGLKSVAGLALFLTFWFTLQTLNLSQKNTEIAQNTLDSSRQGQVTERYTKAIEMLSSPDRGVRVGAIYALQRLMKDSADDQPTVVNVLATFIRANTMPPAQLPEVGEVECDGARTYSTPTAPGVRRLAPELPTDIQAALTVLGNRNISRELPEFHLDLHGAYLVGAVLRSAHLENAILDKTDLSQAEMQGAHLRGASLAGTRMIYTCLYQASFQSTLVGPGTRLDHAFLNWASFDNADMNCVSLIGAQLSFASFELTLRLTGDQEYRHGSNITDAHMEGADLTFTNFKRAKLKSVSTSPQTVVEKTDFRGADLRIAWGLSDTQLAQAQVDENTQLPGRTTDAKPPACNF